MSVLQYKTRNNVITRGMPRVYFCCDPEDFNVLFEEISNEILKKQDCAIWYYGNKRIEYNEEFFNDLSQMNLFLVPITGRLLKEENPVLEREFRFALEHGIPILPLMQEQGLAGRFNELCGGIQYLDKYNTDSTCIEYSDKLEKFLSAVLMGDEEIQRIRDAFDAYVFLSYRKKDRQYAQKLMKLIHKNHFCRDVAIWYDEFLVPGEDFNIGISDALEKCKLFILAVTPNLVNESNYVMNVEYPMAVKQEKKVLPCEMVDTDKALLKEKYENIPECVDGYDGEKLAMRLAETFWYTGLIETKSDPEHLFFIGLAYLNGIDVEVDRQRAVKLISEAADKNLPEAIGKLIDMYTNGDGVKTDYKKAFELRKKLLAVNEEMYELNKNSDTGYHYMRACYELADSAEVIDLHEETIEYSVKLKEICASVVNETECDEFLTQEFKRHIALAEVLLGVTYHSLSRLSESMQCYDNALKIFEELEKKTDSTYILRDVSILYNKMAQLYKVRAEYNLSLEYYEKALKIQKENALKIGEEVYQTDQVLTMNSISEIKRLLWNIEGAKKTCLETIDFLERQIKVYGTVQLERFLLFTQLSLAETYRFSGDYEGALEEYNTLIKMEDKYFEQYGERFEYVQALRLMKMTHVFFQLKDFEKTIECGERAIAYVEENGINLSVATGSSEVASTYLFVGIAYRVGRCKPDIAAKYIKSAAERTDEYLQRGVVCNMPDVVLTYASYGDLLQTEDKVDEAEKYLKKGVEIYERYCSAEDTRNLLTAFTIYVALGKNYSLKEQNMEAIALLEKALDISKEIIQKIPFAEETMNFDIATVFYLLGCCYAEIKKKKTAKEYFYKCLEVCEKDEEEKRILGQWDIMGISLYQLCMLTANYFKRKKLEKSVLETADKMQKAFPELFEKTVFYQVLAEIGIYE